MNGNQVLGVLVFSLLILTVVFFSIENPYWYTSILTLTIAVFIILLKMMWNIAGWADNKLNL